MVSLVDIGPAKGTVTIREQEVDVFGMTANDIVMLFNKFPELRRIVTGKADGDVIANIFAQFGHLISNLVAAALGELEDEATVVVASTLTLGEAWMIIEKCLSLTFPQTPKSFIDSLLAIVGEDVKSGWAQATTLQPQSPVASAPDETKETAGTAPPAS